MPSSIDPRIVQALRQKKQKPDPIAEGIGSFFSKFSNFGKPEEVPMSGDFASVDERDEYVKSLAASQPETPENVEPPPSVPSAPDIDLMKSRNGDTVPQAAQTIPAIAPQPQEPDKPQPVQEAPRQPATQQIEQELNLENQNYSAPEYEDSDTDLRAAHEAAQNNRTLNALGKSGDMLVSALTGTKARGDVYDQLDKNSNQAVQELMDRRKAQDQTREFQIKEASRDPKSPDNQAFRAFLRQQPEFAFLTKSPSFENLTLANPALTKIVDMYQKSQDRRASIEVARQNAEARRLLDQERLGVQKDRMNLSERRFQDKLTQQDELPAKALDKVAEYNTVMDRVQELSNMKKDFSTGPLDNRIASFRQAVGMDDAKRTAFKMKTGRALADYMRSISGLAMSDKEVARLSKIFLSDNLSDASFLEAVKDIYKEIDRNKQIYLDTYKQGGRSVEALRQNPTRQQQPVAKPKPGPGSIVVVKGIKYRVGQDGDSLEQIQ